MICTKQETGKQRQSHQKAIYQKKGIQENIACLGLTLEQEGGERMAKETSAPEQSKDPEG